MSYPDYLKESNNSLSQNNKYISRSNLQLKSLNDSNYNDNLISIPKEELDNIIITLESTINNIKKEKNWYFKIEELDNIIENIIEKLKKFMKNSINKYNNINNIEKTNKNELLKSNTRNYSPIKTKKINFIKNNNSPSKTQIDFKNHKYSNSFNYINDLNDINNNNFNNTQIINRSVQNNTYLNTKIKAPIREKSPSETRYNGPRVNGKKEGKGIYLYPNGSRYEGYFKNDKKDGFGIFYYKNGDRYEGNFVEGNYEGNGIFYFNNGDRYEGQFKKNKYSGKGKYFYRNGDFFDGYWLDDKKNGDGTYNYVNGDKTIGKYFNGNPYGTHIRYCIDGNTYQINY